MPDKIIDLRSDTVTKPTPAMWAAISTAELGDDVHGEDPTVNRLQERVAELLGKEAALFVPSGTMSNQICIRAQTEPGDELFCERTNHIYLYEAGAPAVLSGLLPNLLDGENGVVELDQFRAAVRPPNEHYVRPRIVCLENTHNRGGGQIYPLDKMEAISRWAAQNDLIMHLDGARLMNAVVASGIPAAKWAAPFDSVSICFSKGLGAPVGSALAGTKTMVTKARRIRKVLGGGMRQAGVIAAAALYAVDNHVERLAEDHENAQIVAEAVRNTPGLTLTPPNVQTNIVYAEIDPSLGTAGDVTATLTGAGIRVSQLGPQLIRMCTHLDVSRADCEQFAKRLPELVRKK